MKKRVIALLMALCLMGSTALAAGYTDQEEIDCAEAVQTLTELGVFQGDPDGAFRPDDTLTRAEAAKLLFVLDQGTDDASSYANLPTTFTDLVYDWYQGYIKWAQQEEIVAGHSAERFEPEGDVTGLELAKMLLVLYGADPDGLTGADWEENTAQLAGEKGYLDGMDFDLRQPIARQWAAQMIVQAMPPQQPDEPEEPETPDRTRFTLTGYVLDDGTTKLSPTDLMYVEFPVWNGEQVWELCLDPDTLKEDSGIEKGAFVQLENYAWGYRFDAGDVTVYDGAADADGKDSSVIGAVQSYEPERNLIVLSGDNDQNVGYPLRDDVAVIGFDSEENTAAEGATVAASDTENVLLVLDDEEWVTAIFVDVRGDLQKLTIERV